MKRIHLFEFEDLSWFPDIIRNGGTDYLGFVLRLSSLYAPVPALLKRLFEESKTETVIDLCSGNGDVVSFISEQMDEDLNVHFKLSDKFPNLPAYEKIKERSAGNISYEESPLDVLEMENFHCDFFTMFTAIHHFKPVEVRKIIGQLVNNGKSFALFDSGDKHLFTILGILVCHPLLFFFCTPFFKPSKWSRILFTYLIPLIPLYTIWDGVVSIFRLYRPDTLLNLAKQADHSEEFNWNAGQLKNKYGLKVTYLSGVKKSL